MVNNKNWHFEAFKLYGYLMGCSNHHDAVAKALEDIEKALVDSFKEPVRIVLELGEHPPCDHRIASYTQFDGCVDVCESERSTLTEGFISCYGVVMYDFCPDCGKKNVQI